LQRTLREIADLVEGEVIGNDQVRITGIQSLDDAVEGELSFLTDKRYRNRVKDTKASAILVAHMIDLFEGPQIVVPNPSLAYAKVAGLFAPPVPRVMGISPEASIDKDCQIGNNVSIYPHVYVGPNAVIGNDVTLFPSTFIGAGARIGEKSVLYPNVTIFHDCVIGCGVIIHSGSVIGSNGFGFARDGAKSVRIPQIGIVQIDDDVEIGANNTIDRAALGKTWIKRGVKTDNHVHIAHNVVIGENTIIVAQTGISGSVQIGRSVVIGGRVGMIDHLQIGDTVMIGPGSYVYKSIPNGDVVSGIPIMPHRQWLKILKIMPKLPRINDRLRELEKKVEALEKKEDNGTATPV
jgi:UDP-3-O-[3-hydroxymyristoyl] glucosamine N-acyltransferase